MEGWFLSAVEISGVFFIFSFFDKVNDNWFKYFTASILLSISLGLWEMSKVMVVK